jgi:selenocysteine lyase/cysteine desulfurase
MDLNDYRALFPHVAEGILHFNHAGSSPLSSVAASEMIRYISELTYDPGTAQARAFPRYAACRQRIADMMGVPSSDVAMTKNTAHGLSIIADGLDFSDGDEVVFADCEYPSNTYPWLAQAWRGVRSVIVRTRPDGMIDPQDYAASVTRRTRVIAVSWVQFGTGYRADLDALAEIAHNAGALLVVDVIQGLGLLPCDLARIGVDMAATGSQKWLMGPLGVGAVYVRPSVLDHLRLVNMGAGAVKNVLAFDPLGFDPKATTQRYEEGSPNLVGAIGLDASMGVLQGVGMQNVWESVRSVTRHAMESLKSKGYTVTSPEKDDQRAGIVLFRHPTLPNSDVLAALKAGGVICVERGGNCRFAPHFYNNMDDIDRAVALLPA